ncbi:MAG: putative lipid II flippase FtsW, partial [Actinomycetota bacterium]
DLLLRAQVPGEAEAGAAGGRKAPPAAILLTVTTLTLVATGLVMILSASSIEAYKRYGSSFLLFNRQVIGAVVGLGAMFVLARVDYRVLRRIARPLLFGVILLMVFVLVPGVGVTRAGSVRWLPLGPFSLQPSEIAKLAVVLFAAHALERKGARIADPKELAYVAPAVGIVLLLIMLQPDLGTALIVGGCALIVMFLAGTRMRHVVSVVGVVLVGVVTLILGEGYRRARLFSFLDPWADPLNTGYQTIQGQIALGSGGLFGLGLGASRQKWSYLPHAHTDFIYAIIGEELGLVGTLAVLSLFVFFVYLGIRTARRAPDRFGMLLAGGITGWVGLQALINMGAVTGLLPITGVPLPLISFGGSALVFTLAGIGVLMSVARRGRA